MADHEQSNPKSTKAGDTEKVRTDQRAISTGSLLMFLERRCTKENVVSLKLEGYSNTP